MLDDSTPFTIIDQGSFGSGSFPCTFVEYHASSPLITRLELIPFRELGTLLWFSQWHLDILDYLRLRIRPWIKQGDWWIARKRNGPTALNGRSVTGLSIFSYLGRDALNGPTSGPPSPIHDRTFQYFVSFSDGTHQTRRTRVTRCTSFRLRIAVTQVIYAVIPLYQKFRVGARHLFLAAFGASFLAGYAIAALQRGEIGASRVRGAAIALLPARRLRRGRAGRRAGRVRV